MSEELKQVAMRLRAIREIAGVSADALAIELNLNPEQYTIYESGEVDIPVSVLYAVASKLGVELVSILTGEEPHLHKYSLVKNGEGLDVNRSKQYNYKNLAYKLQNKKAEPFLVMVDPSPDEEPIHLNTHPGQEIDYILEGSVIIQIGNNVLTLSEGDTLFYDSTSPHGMKAVGNQPAKFLAIIF